MGLKGGRRELNLLPTPYSPSPTESLPLCVSSSSYFLLFRIISANSQVVRVVVDGLLGLPVIQGVRVGAAGLLELAIRDLRESFLVVLQGLVVDRWSAGPGV